MDFSVHRLKATDSTNAWLQRRLTSEDCAEGLVVVADFQTGGRGYGENSWESEAGKNLTFSVLLKPHFVPPRRQFLLTQLVSLALLETVSLLLENEPVRIKWPNDLYLGDGKVAGLLIQNFIRGQHIENTVVGVGLNVNQEHFLSDAPNPVSLIQKTKKPLDTAQLLDDFLQRLDGFYQRAKDPAFQRKLEADYLKHLYRSGEESFFREGNKRFRARIEGVGPFGELRLRLEDGSEKLYGFKEVEFLL